MVWMVEYGVDSVVGQYVEVCQVLELLGGFGVLEDVEVEVVEAVDGTVEVMVEDTIFVLLVLETSGGGALLYNESLLASPQINEPLPAHGFWQLVSDFLTADASSVLPQKHSLPFSVPKYV